MLIAEMCLGGSVSQKFDTGLTQTDKSSKKLLFCHGTRPHQQNLRQASPYDNVFYTYTYTKLCTFFVVSCFSINLVISGTTCLIFLLTRKNVALLAIAIFHHRIIQKHDIFYVDTVAY